MREVKFAENLKVLRRKKNVSQINLAKSIGAGRHAVSNWEHGYIFPNLSYVIDIANKYDVSIDDLVFGEIKNDR